MSTIAPPVRGKSWLWQVTALSIVLGALLALSLKTQRQAVEKGEPNRRDVLSATYLGIKRENNDLKKQLTESKLKVEKLVRQQARGIHGKDYLRMLDESKMLAGTAAVHGSGIIVTLHDSPKKPAEIKQDAVSDYIVHDRDIRDIVNELFASGAEAISINDQRMIATSSIRCVGPVVLVNSTQTAPPFVIRAIGKPDVLENALKLPMGVADGLFLLDMIEITKEPDIRIPAYSGVMKFSSAKPSEANPE